jgi:diguanylate cyclase (GGDEF)-like protein
VVRPGITWRVPRPLFALGAVVIGLGAVYIVSLLPFVRGDAGTWPLFDVWLNLLVKAGVVAVVALRGWYDRRMRAAWWCLSAGLFAAFLGSFGYYTYYRHQDPVPFPSWTDAGFIGLYVLAYPAIVLMLRDRIWPFPRSLWLDGFIASFTAAAFAAAFVLEPALEATKGEPATVAVTLAYPVADLLLVMFLAGGLVIMGAGGRTWGWLATGLLLFFFTDGLYVNEAANGTYESGDPIDIGWTLARMCFVGAALDTVRQAPAMRPGTTRLLFAPAFCSFASLALLYTATRTELPATAAALAVLAITAAIGRAVLAFRELAGLAESRREAATDDLTGLPNRRAFLRSLRDTAVTTRRSQTMAVLLLDLDRFKDVNDSLGHATGDKLLRLVATRLASVLRPRDVFARLGGDEFAVIAAVDDAAGALTVAARLRKALEAPFEIGAAVLYVDASIGIALGPEQADGADELMQLADLAMYASKERGEDALIYDEERDGAGRHRLELVAQLREAISSDQMFLEYQPKIVLATGRPIGVEALVRWRHPERGVLGPQHFVEIAESSGTMRALTGVVMDLALAQTRRWHDEGLGLTVAVNVSPSDLIDQSFPDHVEQRLAAHGVPSSALVVEITENHVMEDRPQATRVLERLRALGVGVAVDDFGTGYSSLAYLAELPLTEVKLDRAFIKPMLETRKASSIVESTVRLARALDLTVVAEGVEDRQTLDALEQIGCAQAQGFFIGRPTSADAIGAMLVGDSLSWAEREG